MTTSIPSLLVSAVLALLAGAPAAPAAQPLGLRIVRSWPLQVSGTGFYARERVRVTVRTGSRVRAASTRSDAHGAFTVHFRRVRLNVCGLPFTVTARGARGDVASAPRPMRECASQSPG